MPHLRDLDYRPAACLSPLDPRFNSARLSKHPITPPTLSPPSPPSSTFVVHLPAKGDYPPTARTTTTDNTQPPHLLEISAQPKRDPLSMSRPPSSAASAAQPSLDSFSLPLTHSGDDVTFPVLDDPSVEDAGSHADQHDEEAALEALRAAISGSHEDHSAHAAAAADAPAAPTLQAPVTAEAAAAELAHPTLIPASQVQVQSIDKAVAALQQLSSANQAIIDNMNAPSILQGLMGSFKVLADSNRRQAELVKNLIDSIQGRGAWQCFVCADGHQDRQPLTRD